MNFKHAQDSIDGALVMLLYEISSDNAAGAALFFERIEVSREIC
jgi:hypothetical protein